MHDAPRDNHGSTAITMTPDELARQACAPPPGRPSIYLRLKVGAARASARVVRTAYVPVEELTHQRVVEELDALRAHVGPGPRAWVDVLATGERRSYAGPLELDRHGATVEDELVPDAPPPGTSSSSSSSSSAGPSEAAFAHLTSGLVSLASHFRDVTDRLLDTVDRQADELATLRERVGRLAARRDGTSSSSSTSPDDDEAPRDSAIRNLSDLLSQVVRKVAEPSAPAGAVDVVAQGKAYLRGLPPERRAEEIARMAQAAAELADELAPDAQT